MDDFLEFRWKKKMLSKLGLPDIGYPVPASRMDLLLSEEDLEFNELLYWLQEYSDQRQEIWLDLEAAMLRLAELIAPEDSREEIVVGGEEWTLVCGGVDLSEEVITIQRQDRLVAAIQSLPAGGLRVAAYRPLNAKSADSLINLSQKPDPDGTVCMRPNNWEYALDASGGMGQAYADSRGESYLAYWQFGLGLDQGKNPIEGWYSQREAVPMPANLLMIQLGTYYTFSADPEA